MVGAIKDDEGAVNLGAVYIIFLSLGPIGSVLSHQKISSSQGGFTADWETSFFGNACDAADDMNGIIVDLFRNMCCNKLHHTQIVLSRSFSRPSLTFNFLSFSPVTCSYR